MSEDTKRPGSPAIRALGFLLLTAGLAVFLIRFQHAGPYGFPRGGNLLGGLLALALGAFFAFGQRLFAAGLGWLRYPLLAAAPIVLFFALYATLAELEEVIVLKATHTSGAPSDLRLWIVDAEGAEWVTMPRSKAADHGLDRAGAEVPMLRAGELRCVAAAVQEDRSVVNKIHHLRNERYAIQRLATRVGIFGEDADPSTITLRLTPCERAEGR